MHSRGEMAGEQKEDFPAIAARVAPQKAIVSELGWVFLINDTNDFMRWYCGVDSWTAEDRLRAGQTLHERLQAISIPYRKFIVPEKVVVYPEFAPRSIQAIASGRPRPAQILAGDHPETVFYLDEFLRSLKGMGPLYFRADTHPNWLGAWAVYRFIVHKLVSSGLLGGSETKDISHLFAQAVAYEGDLLPHLSPETMRAFKNSHGFSFPAHGLEWSIKLDIPPERQLSFLVETPSEYRRWYPSRETIVYERPSRSGQKVIFFRDSTFDRGALELLAQHCGRAVFVWHQGVVDLDIIEREKPDLIVHCMAERFVERYRDTRAFVRAKN